MGRSSPGTSSPVLIRPAQSGDRAQVVDNINLITAEEIYLQTDHFAPTADWERVLGGDSDNPAEGRLLIVPVAGGQVVGHLRIFAGGYGAKDRHVGSIGVALLPAYRGVGIGSTLLERGLAWAGPAGFVKMEAYVIASNLRARRLFQKFGFQLEGTRRQQLLIRGRYEDELVVARFL
jgi:hypothetical protein